MLCRLVVWKDLVNTTKLRSSRYKKLHDFRDSRMLAHQVTPSIFALLLQEANFTIHTQEKANS
jgi:hypothetical protein